MNAEHFKSDYLIVGSGMAGLNAALEAAEHGTVILLNKCSRKESSSYWAQGGVAAVLKSPDTFQSHIEDTLLAGRNYGNIKAVELLVREGSEKVKELIEMGMPFDRTGTEFDMGLEGGHSKRRILHASGAATGKALVDFLYERTTSHKNIKIIEHAFVYDLIVGHESNVCRGVSAYLYKENKSVQISGGATILATGGYSGLYSRTTNPHTSTGDGLWLAYKHGAVLKDLEFIQFHPTAYYSSTGSSFLISEALRGEGARLHNTSGERFMLKYEKKELAPRDIVSREIYRQIKNQKEDFVYLSVQHLDVERLKAKFSGLLSKIEKQGINIQEEGIPVAPAAHYCIGGVETDLDAKTAVGRLYAVGELGATGVHGANRLASNSLLECLVFSHRAVKHATGLTPLQPKTIPANELKVNPEKEEFFKRINAEIVNLMHNGVGIERHKDELDRVLKVVDDYLVQTEIFERNEYFSIRLKGLLVVAKLITKSALQRDKSLGVHSRRDSRNITGLKDKAVKWSHKDVNEMMKQAI